MHLVAALRSGRAGVERRLLQNVRVLTPIAECDSLDKLKRMAANVRRICETRNVGCVMVALGMSLGNDGFVSVFFDYNDAARGARTDEAVDRRVAAPDAGGESRHCVLVDVDGVDRRRHQACAGTKAQVRAWIIVDQSPRDPGNRSLPAGRQASPWPHGGYYIVPASSAAERALDYHAPTALGECLWNGLHPDQSIRRRITA